MTKWRFLGLFVVLLFATSPISPQQKQAGKAETRKQQPKWETLAPGVRVLRLWKTKELSEPQAAILELSTQVQQEFHADAKTFINKYQIFPKAVREGSCLELMGKRPVPIEKDGGCCKSFIIHYRDSSFG